MVDRPVVGVDAAGLRDLQRLARDIDRLTIGGDFRRELRTELRAAGEVVAEAARGNASWSSRIPGSIRVSVTQKGVSVKAGGKKAPHAAPYESGTSRNGGTLRHPVFARGDRSTWTWVTEQTRPFLLPALRANLELAAEKAADAVDRAFRSVGWR